MASSKTELGMVFASALLRSPSWVQSLCAQKERLILSLLAGPWSSGYFWSCHKAWGPEVPKGMLILLWSAHLAQKVDFVGMNSCEHAFEANRIKYINTFGLGNQHVVDGCFKVVTNISPSHWHPAWESKLSGSPWKHGWGGLTRACLCENAA